MAAASPSEDRLDLAAGPDADTQAQAWVEAIAARHGWGPRLLFGIALSLEEVVANVVNHGFPQPPAEGARIWLRCTVAHGRVTLRIEDNGIAFDPTRFDVPKAAPTLEDADVGGHGIQLVRHYMDEVRYAREGGRNVLVLGTNAA